jgi:hypothetical protein
MHDVAVDVQQKEIVAEIGNDMIVPYLLEHRSAGHLIASAARSPIASTAGELFRGRHYDLSIRFTSAVTRQGHNITSVIRWAA